MNKFLKYFIIFGLACLAAFTAYVKWKEIENKRPTIFIDNYAGFPVEIKYRNTNWIQLDDNTSSVKNDLNQGTYFLHVKNMTTSSTDTIRIDIKEKKNYVLNISKAMTYYTGNLVYRKMANIKKVDRNEELQISEIFFQTSADFLFKKPSNQIEILTKTKTPQHFNTTATKKYIRRANQNW